ncbi:MAG: YaiO family outer membrane beta-barrel protein [Maribacter sp.]|uniref:YaiO family outer membrane beta-barrel protein n=1 Tax=Maribacter sp. TaxID=1897614 RepID=UPI003C70A941
MCVWLNAQDVAYTDASPTLFENARHMVYEGDHRSAKDLLLQVLTKAPDHWEARTLLARTYSWNGKYDKARDAFNKVIAVERNQDAVWISAIKNELYSKNEATALGLANKALLYIKNNKEIERLREMALNRIDAKEYTELGWYNQESALSTKKVPKEQRKGKTALAEKKDGEPSEEEPSGTIKPITPADKDVQNNRVSIQNAVTVYDQRYDPMVYSSVSYKRHTLAGSIIPRINYSNRLGKNGLQYDLDFYPKFSKRFYAYINYGYSEATIYPNHKLGGDLYVNLPWAMEFSAGGRYINFDTKNVSVITNSIGHYRGNYYFSFRSYITPRPDNLTRFSGNVLVRKYLKDAENYMGVNFGMGYSPELRQLTSGDVLLAETLLYIESQRLSFEYQFTAKKSPNIYRANMGVTRQELVYDSGNYFWAISGGFTYQVKF